jgi:hypothetical protein
MSVISKKSHQPTANFNIVDLQNNLSSNLPFPIRRTSVLSGTDTETKSMVYTDPQTGFTKLYRIPNLALNKQIRVKAILKSQRNKNLPILRVGFQLLTKVTADYQSHETRSLLQQYSLEKMELKKSYRPTIAFYVHLKKKLKKSKRRATAHDILSDQSNNLNMESRRTSDISVPTNSNGDRSSNQNQRRLRNLPTNANLPCINTGQQFNDRKPSRNVKTEPEMKKDQTTKTNETLPDIGLKASTAAPTSKIFLLEERRQSKK